MLFPSITFLFYFLPLFLAAYYVLPFKNLTIVVASLVFYFWGEKFHHVSTVLSSADGTSRQTGLPSMSRL